MPATSPRAQAVAELANVVGFDEEGDEITEDGPYDDYVESLPPREERRRFKEPVYYWEPRWPGCSLHPYPRLGALYSRHSGVWECEFPWQERAVREHLTLNVRVDPDTLKIGGDELAILGGTKEGPIRYCHGAACHFFSPSLVAADLHEAFTGHTTKNHPRKD